MVRFPPASTRSRRSSWSMPRTEASCTSCPTTPAPSASPTLPESAVIQRDRDGSVLPSLPPVWGKAAITPKPDPDYPASMPNRPVRPRRTALRSAGGRTDARSRSTASTRTGCRSTAAGTTCSSPGRTSARWRWATIRSEGTWLAELVEAIHPRRPFLHGRFRRIEPQPFLARSAPARRMGGRAGDASARCSTTPAT